MIKPSLSTSEIEEIVKNLSIGQKYKLLTNHFNPSSKFAFPKVFDSGCYRSFQYRWLEKHTWLVYSKELNGGFCKFCALFAKERQRYGVLVNKPFEKWVKVNKVVDGHASNLYHQNALKDGMAFIHSVEHPEQNVDVCLNNERLRNIKENRHILKCCANCILLFCGRQNVALRGHRENLDSDINSGNFLALLKLLSNYDSILKSHLEKPRLRNATYISPNVQNQIIDIIGRLIIQKDIVDEIVHAKFYSCSVMVDEVTSHNQELMPLCIRFVDKECKIREEFMQYSALTRITGEAIASVVISNLQELGLEVCNIRGQGYDGASSMSSGRVGLQACIREKAPLAVYTHCAGHCLNLVIGHSCGIPIVRNIIDKVKSVCLFFLNSPKRNKLLLELVTNGTVEGTKRKPLLELCKTRWAARHEAYQHFYQCYTFLIKSFEVIALNLHLETLSNNFSTATWDADSKSNANSLLNGIADFEFIVVFLIIY